MEKILYRQPTDEEVAYVAKLGFKYVPVYNNGIINHYKLTVSKTKGCNCANR